MFSGIVSKASTLDVLSTGVAGNYNGALQVVMWNFHVFFEKLFSFQLYSKLIVFFYIYIFGAI